MFQFACARCGLSFNGEEQHIGRQIRCTGCGNLVTISRPGHYQSSKWSINSRPTPETISKLTSVLGKFKIKRNWLHIGAIVFVIVGLSVFIASKMARQSDPLASGKGPSNQAVSTRAAPISTSESVYKLPQAEQESQPFVIDDSPPQAAPFSFPTGTQLASERGRRGHGELEALNGSSEDAAVTLTIAGAHRRVRSVYVRKGENVVIKGLAPGEYDILFQIGLDWDRYKHRFKREADSFEFGKILSYEEKSDDEGVHFSKHTITLYPVLGGDVQSRPITEEEFNALGGNTN